jgi:5-methylcytosine-specific restriction endonuclease McrA
LQRATLKCVRCQLRAPRTEFLAPRNANHRRAGVCRLCRVREAAAHPKIPRTVRKVVWELCEGRCMYCDVGLDLPASWHIDHVHARRHGGQHGLHNWLLSCSHCNCIVLSGYPELTRSRYARGWQEVRAARLGLEERSTFWERRAFVQERLRMEGRPYALSTLEELQRRVRHLAPHVVGFVNPS